MTILNSSQYRRVNNKVTYQQICNWFANQRRTMQRLAAQQQQAQAVQATQQQQRQSCSSNSSSSGTAVNGIVGNGGSGGGPLAILPLNATGVGNNNVTAVENQGLVFSILFGFPCDPYVTFLINATFLYFRKHGLKISAFF